VGGRRRELRADKAAHAPRISQPLESGACTGCVHRAAITFIASDWARPLEFNRGTAEGASPTKPVPPGQDRGALTFQYKKPGCLGRAFHLASSPPYRQQRQ
jgi:hypothetical protein